LKRFIFSLCLFITFSTPSLSQAQDCEFIQSNTFSLPSYVNKSDLHKICHIGYDTLYDESKHNPLAVFYNVDPANVVGKFKRVGSFRTDPDTNDPYVLDAYSHTGYDRGHVAPAGIFRSSHQINTESFYQTNMTPQLANLNRGIWKKLETYDRKYVIKTKNTLSVVAGPVYGPNPTLLDDGEGNKVEVPIGFFKVILNNGKLMGAYLFKNKRYHTKELPTLMVSIDDIEAATGLDLFTNLKLDETVVPLYPF